MFCRDKSNILRNYKVIDEVADNCVAVKCEIECIFFLKELANAFTPTRALSRKASDQNEKERKEKRKREMPNFLLQEGSSPLIPEIREYVRFSIMCKA